MLLKISILIHDTIAHLNPKPYFYRKKKPTINLQEYGSQRLYTYSISDDRLRSDCKVVVRKFTDREVFFGHNFPWVSGYLIKFKLQKKLNMAVYNIKETDWEKVIEFWEYEFPNELKDVTVFQMEPFPPEGLKSITFISDHPEAVFLVKNKFGIEENKFWSSLGAQGLKRLTGINSRWVNIPLQSIREFTPMSKERWKSMLIQLKKCYDFYLRIVIMKLEETKKYGKMLIEE